MFLYGGLAGLCLIAGFGLGMYEFTLRRQIVNAVHKIRPDLETFALFARARSGSSSVHALYREHYSQGNFLRRHRMVSVASPACFIGFAVLLVVAIRHS